MSNIQSTITWDISKEIGIKRKNMNGGSVLCFPVIAQYTEKGDIFVSDPDNIEAQVFMISKSSGVFYMFGSGSADKEACIDPAGYIGDGMFWGVNRKKRCVLQYNPAGEICRSFDGGGQTFYPIAADIFENGDMVIADRGDRKIYLVDREMKLKSVCGINDDVLIRPCAIQALKNGNYLVTDEAGHMVFEADFSGKIVWKYGTYNYPGDQCNQLTYPQCAKRLQNGNTLIADAMNHRVIEVNPAGKIVWQYRNQKDGYMEVNGLFWPTWAEKGKDGRVLIADGKNKRIIEVGEDGEVLWSFGEIYVERRLLGYPRSIQLLDNKELLIADTINNRVVQIDGLGNVKRVLGGDDSEFKLFWPRSAWRIPNGNTIVADGRNSRVIIIDKNDLIIREITFYKWCGRLYSIKDPHYCKMLKNGNILVVDSPANAVIEINHENEAVWQLGLYEKNCKLLLNDPHMASRNSDGYSLVTDTGNSRLLLVSKDKRDYREYRYLKLGDKKIRIDSPRFCDFFNNNRIIMADGSEGAVYIFGRNGMIGTCFKAEDREIKQMLKKTRKIIMFSDYSAYVSDYLYCRIVKLSPVKARLNEGGCN